MKKRTPVAKIMTSSPISVNLRNGIGDVVQIFADHNIHHLPVVSGDRLIGMISKTDIERISYVEGYDEGGVTTMVNEMLTLEQVMTKQVETIQVDDQIKEAAQMLAKGEYHALPVLDGQQLTGIVTSTDVIKYLLAQF
ncbi:MAG: CBS domain-containing protein [Bacteroidota bacterium]